MDQLVVLQEIYESFSKGTEVLHSIDSKAIEGNCSNQVAKLLDSSKEEKIDADLCLELANCLQDAYEIKRLGDICKKAGLLELAIRCYDKALSMTRDKSVKAVLLNNLGQVYTRYGDSGRSVAYYKRAVKAFQCAGDNSGLAHVQGNLGSAYRRGRDWDKSLEYCHKSLKAFEELGDELGAAQMTGSLGRVYAEMGEIDLARRYFEKSLRDFQKLGDRRSEGWVLNRLGRMSSRSKNWDEAIKYYNLSQSIFQDLGQENSSAIVLSNLGQVYLDKGEAALARDYLERALKNLRKDMRPAYQNASAWLAATYSVLAKEHQREAKSDTSIKASGSDKKAEEKRKLASGYYSRAADRFIDLASTHKIDLPELNMAASIARFLSALDELQAEQKDEEAVLLADRAIFALEDAIASSSGEELDQMEAMARTLTGMKGIWALCQIGKEPWKLARSVADSTEYMMGGIHLPGETGACIHHALQSLRGTFEEEKLRNDPSELLRATASNIRRAEKRFLAEGTDLGYESAISLGKAAVSIEKLINAGTGTAKTASSQINELLNYKAHRNALLLIGWVLMRNALPAVDRTVCIYSWDESMKLIEKRPIGESESASRVERAKALDIMEIEEENEIEEVEVEPIIDFIQEPNEPSTIERTIVEQDVKDESFSEGYAIEEISANGGNGSCLVPVMGQQLQYPQGARTTAWSKQEIKSNYRVDRFEPVVEVVASGSCNHTIIDAAMPQASKSQSVVQEDTPIKESSKVQVPQAEFSSAQSQCGRTFSFGNSIFSQSNIIKILKAVALLVLVLFCIDVILYLI